MTRQAGASPSPSPSPSPPLHHRDVRLAVGGDSLDPYEMPNWVHAPVSGPVASDNVYQWSDGRKSWFSPLNGRYPKTQSANDRFGVSKPNSFLWPGHDDRHEYGPSCKQLPAPRNGRPADVRYLVLISMVAMTAKGTMRASTNARAPEPSFSFSGPPKAASGVGPVWLHCSHRTTT